MVSARINLDQHFYPDDDRIKVAFVKFCGMATGVVHKIAEDSSHKLCGSFKIMSDGIITRFTGLSKADWNNAMRNAEAEYKTKYEAETTEPATEQKVAV